jgi:hypothetical protein
MTDTQCIAIMVAIILSHQNGDIELDEFDAIPKARDILNLVKKLNLNLEAK